MPEKEIVIVNQKTQPTSLSDFQNKVGDYDKDSFSIIPKNIASIHLQDFESMKKRFLASRKKFIEVDLDKMKAKLY